MKLFSDYFKLLALAAGFCAVSCKQVEAPLWSITSRPVRRRREATEAAPAETVLPRNMMEQITAVIEEKELYRRKN